ncbi:Ger(x)C family spore germination protein [Paenibacillus sp. CC-CFT747]|nr:Ger(x)C family spore germination protein [Paenibacillus sp. CC-CFT747]
MKRRRTILLPLLVCLLLPALLTGCWDRRELNELSVVLAMGVDMVGGEYMITLQAVDPSQMTKKRSSQRSPIFIVSEKEKTIYEALRKITTKSSRKLYASHLRLLLLDEKVAKKGISDALDLILRDHEPRPDFYIALSRGYTAKDILSLVTPFEVLPGVELYKSLQLSEKQWAPTSAVNVVELFQMLRKEGLEPTLTGVTVIGNVRKGKTNQNVKDPTTYGEYQFGGIGVFRGDRLMGWLNESDSKAYDYVTNRVHNTVGKVRCPRGEGYFVVEIKRSKAILEPSIKEGKPELTIHMNMEGDIGEMECKADLTKEQDFVELEQAGTKELLRIVQEGVRHEQEQYGVDIYGFGTAFHRHNPDQWKSWKSDWNERFKEMPVTIKPEFKLRRFGKIISPLEDLPKD